MVNEIIEKDNNNKIYNFLINKELFDLGIYTKEEWVAFLLKEKSKNDLKKFDPDKRL